MEQETIEEAAKKYYEDNIDQSNIPREHYELEIQELMAEFAYECKQQMYSEEDLKEAFECGIASGIYQVEYGKLGSMDFNFFIEQFKNK